jgi:hypothetical protein
MEDNSAPKVITNALLKEIWNGFVELHSLIDFCTQTFGYSNIPAARYVLEIACGIDKMKPFTVSLK